MTEYLDIIVSGVTGLADTEIYRVWIKPAPANIRQYLNTACPSADTAGYPKVTIKSGTGNGEMSLSGGKTLLQDGAITRDVFADSAGIKPIRSGTAQAGGTNTITLDAGASSVSDIYLYKRVAIGSSTSDRDSAICIAYNGSTKVLTVHRDWLCSTPGSGTPFSIVPDGEAELATILASRTAALNLKRLYSSFITGTVVSDAGNSSTTFKTDLTQSTNDFFAVDGNWGMNIQFIDGNLAGNAMQLKSYNGTTKFLTTDYALPATPSNGSLFILLGFVKG